MPTAHSQAPLLLPKTPTSLDESPEDRCPAGNGLQSPWTRQSKQHRQPECQTQKGRPPCCLAPTSLRAVRGLRQSRMQEEATRHGYRTACRVRCPRRRIAVATPNATGQPARWELIRRHAGGGAAPWSASRPPATPGVGMKPGRRDPRDPGESTLSGRTATYSDYYYFVRFTGRALNDSPCTFARTSVRCASDDDTGAGAVAAARPVS